MRSSIAAGATIIAAMMLMASTWFVFSATTDEPMHLTAGLELLGHHRYSVQPENPPLPRLVFSFLPWRMGLRFDPSLMLFDQLKRVYHEGGRYQRNLAIARAGNLPFFLLAAIATWWWARRELGDTGGFVAMLLFALQPCVLGYSAVVTHDAASLAGVALALLAYVRWLDRPAIPNAILFGAAYGFSIACKFSSIPYVPAACLAMYLVRFARDTKTRRAWRSALIAFPIAFATAAAVLWVSYAGSIDTFVTGVRGLLDMDRAGHAAYLFGNVSPSGWWWYFPAGVVLKTTLGTLLLVALGFFFARKERVFAEALAAAIAILLVSMNAHLDLGVRYVLPMYIPLAVAASATAVAMLRAHATRLVAAALLAVHLVAVASAHPDHIAFFNRFAGNDPSRYLIDSNLEWGQDVLRLARVLREEKVERVGLSLSGNHDYDALGFPPSYAVQSWGRGHGWIAIGDHAYRMLRAEGGWRWLVGREYRRVGRSIRLYYIPR